MRAARTAIRFASDGARPQYVCQSCRIQAARQFSTSLPQNAAGVPWHKRLQESLFGSKESREVEQKRGEKQQKKMDEIAEHGTEEEQPVKHHAHTYKMARPVDPKTNRDYVQASTWDGLKTVGSLAWTKKQADHGEKYIGFLPHTSAQLDNEVWKLVLQSSLVEALTLIKAGRDVSEICYRKHPARPSLQASQIAQIRLSGDFATAAVEFQDAQTEQGILQAINQSRSKNIAASNSSQQLLESLKRQVEHKTISEDSEWMRYQFPNPSSKLAITKRVLQITGKRISDSAISQATSIQDLYDAYKTPVAPTKLHQRTQLKQMKVTIPNVTVHKSKQTHKLQERAIGRWKIIEEELVARKLPLRSSRWKGAKAHV